VTRRIQKAEEEQLIEFLTHVEDTTNNYRLVADYYRRPLAVEIINGHIDSLNEKMKRVDAVRTNNKAFPLWLGLVVTSGWMVIGGVAVIRKEVELGTFIVVLAMFRTAAQDISHLYESFLTMQETFPALWRVVKFMNYPEDVRKRMEADTADSFPTPELHSVLTWSEGKGVPPGERRSLVIEDDIPIELRRVNFQYAGTHRPVFRDVTFAIRQGSLVGVVGAACTGKATLLQILGEVLVPSGAVFVPSHLRILHVSVDVQMFDASVAENLFFGIRPTKGRARDLPHDQLGRGWKILEQLRAPEQLIKLAYDLNREDGEEVAKLSRSDKKLLHIARALIYNPEILIVHSPTSYLDQEHQHVIIDVLRAFVDERGLELPEKTRHRRRPRTCVFSTGAKEDLRAVDKILECRGGRVESRSLQEVEKNLLEWKLGRAGGGSKDVSRTSKE
jgi:ABC-type multidrug transport system fused ATPase/permease subunit